MLATFMKKLDIECDFGHTHHFSNPVKILKAINKT